MSKTRKIRKVILYCVYLAFVVFLGMELLLRVYNPFHLRIKGDKIILPVNQKTTIRNSINPRLDSVIVNTRNSAGLRGPDLPANFPELLSIITVGGSTTECFFLNDDSTWPARLEKLLQAKRKNVWVNNAGLSGHSTFGHQVLLNDHLLHLKPRVILFLIGINDIENDAPTFHDKLNSKGAYPDFVHYLYNNSEVLNIGINIARGYRAKKLNNTTDEWKPPALNNELLMTPAEIETEIKKQEPYLNGYKRRITQLIDTCVRYNILPVFITQPLLYGQGIDSVTGVNLASYKLSNGRSGVVFWKLLQLYNNEAKAVCNVKQVPVIDLAAKMPKNSLYFYDGTHYTNEGASMVASLIADELLPILNARFRKY